MNIDRVVKRFAEIGGQLIERVSDWWQLCSESIDEIRRQLKEGVNEEENEDRLNAAAAAYSFYKYTLYVTSRQATFSADADIATTTITDRRNMLRAAENAWKNALSDVSDILKDENFIFIGIK